MLRKWLFVLATTVTVAIPAAFAEDQKPTEEAVPQQGEAQEVDEAQPAQEAQPTEKEMIEALDQKIRVMERLREIEKEEAAKKAKETPIVGAGKDGFFIKSPDNNFVFKLRAVVHLDGRFFAKDSGGMTQFLARRMRPIFEGTVYKIFDFNITPDFAEGKAQLVDGYARVRLLPEIGFQIGKFKSPVGLERLRGSANLTFVERALPTNVAPNRDMGLQMVGEVKQGVVAYAIGVFDGANDGSSIDGDTNKAKDVAARVFLLPFKSNNTSPLQGLGFGFAVTGGEQDGALPGYKTTAQQTFFTYSSSAVADGQRYRYSPQAYFFYNSFGFLTEYISSEQWVKKADVREKVRNTSWQVAGSYILTGEKATYGSLSPKKPFDPKAKTWGAMEVAARYSQLDIADDAFTYGFADITKSASKAKELAVGFNWYFNKFAKLQIDYGYTTFDGGSAKGDRNTEKVVLSRVQIAF